MFDFFLEYIITPVTRTIFLFIPFQVSPHAVYGIYASPPDAGQFILTAGSDRRIRLWDLQVPENSYIVAGSSSDNLNDVVLNYKYVSNYSLSSIVYLDESPSVTVVWEQHKLR